MRPVREHAKKPSSTKKGPGRYHIDGHQKPTAARRRAKGCGEFSKLVKNYFDRKRREARGAAL